MESGELRYLCNTKKIPEYFHHLLVPIWDKLLIEWDQRRGEYEFENSFRDANEDIMDLNRIIKMRACYRILSLNLGLDNEDIKFAVKELAIIGISFNEMTVERLNKLQRQILKEQTAHDIQLMQSKGSKTPNKVNYIKSVVQMSTILKLHIPKDTITAGEWIELNEQCKQIIKSKKELSENG